MTRRANRSPAILAVAATHAVALAVAIGIAAPATPAAAQEPPLSTFSIVACDTANNFLGVAIQSRVVGAGSIVPDAESGVGAIATQANANVAYKKQALELLQQGKTPDEVKAEFLATDARSASRQFAVVDAACRFATHTGDSTLAWSGHRVGRHYSAQGNILAGPQVVDAMAEAYEHAEASGIPFGERLIAALKAAQQAGGDSRGVQAAGLLIVKPGGGYGGGDDRYADLRVEDHVEPILELERVYNVWMSVFHPEDHFVPRGRHQIAVPAGPHVCALRNLLARAGFGSAAGERNFCAFDEDVIAALKAFQRRHGLPVRPSLTPETAEKLTEVTRTRS